jgi:hypothetical protein
MGLVGWLAGGIVTPGLAQLSGTVDVGAGNNHPDRSLPGAVASFAPAVTAIAGPLRLSGSGVYTDAAGGRWNFQGSSAAVLRSPDLGIFRAEVLGQTDWTWHHRVPGAATLTGEIRAYMMPTPRSLLWVGRGLGNGWSLGRSRPLHRTVTGASTTLGRVRLGLSVTSTTFDALDGSTRGPIDSGAAVPTSTGLVELRTAYTDASLSGEWEMAGLRLDLSMGHRFSRTVPEVMLWGVTATRDLTPGVALLASAGRAGSDPVTALPGSKYLVLGLRLSAGTGGGYVGLGAPAQPAAPAGGFRIGPARITGREIVLHAPGARLVELAADFTDWRPVELDPAPGGDWIVVVPVSPGLHRVAVRTNGGPWEPPPGVRVVASEFGGLVGEVTIE